MRAVQVGDRVRVHWTGFLADGSTFDSSVGGAAVEFEAGGDAVLPGLSLGVVGMKPGEQNTITLEPARAYGERQEGLEHGIPREYVAPDARIGDSVRVHVGDEELVLWIAHLGEDSVILDPNHPLAGQALAFRIELVDFA